MKLYSKELSSNLWKDFESYFEYSGSCSGCWCMNHRLPMGLDFEGEAAKLAIRQLIETNRVYGILAYHQGDSFPVGWCSLDQRKTLPGHDCIGEDISCSKDIWSIHCVTSRSDYKNKGVEEFLCKAVLKLAKGKSAKIVEAYPEPESKPRKSFKTWNTFNGFESFFAELGFQRIESQSKQQKQFYCPMKIEFS